jgi:protein-S-isoprenylcysteine O-methyltransferase Ste14
MNDQSKISLKTKETSLWVLGIRFLFTTILMLGVLFLSAGTIRWWEAWVYVGMTLVILIWSRALLFQKNPDLAFERAQAVGKEDVKGWDRILMPITAVYGPVISWVVAGLDHRFGWTPDLPDWIQIIALGLIIFGSAIGTWAMIVNRFFSSHVRIQTDRGHSVIDEGPYRFVRHPGYAGGLISWIGGPIYFSSYWAVIPTILVMIASVVRTAREDQTLQAELPGYAEYADEVKYRLIPGLW